MQTECEAIDFSGDIVSLWYFVNRDERSNFTEDICASKYIALSNILSGYLIKNNIPGIFSEQDAMDSAHDFLNHLLEENCPDWITSSAVLIANLRKFLARKCNPVQYEMNEIMHEALLALEKDGTIERDESSRNHRISAMTLFAIKGTSTTQNAEMRDYERNKDSVPSYSVRIRGNSAEHTRMLAPAQAKELVLHLLRAFGGWTRKTDLLAAFQNHIPEQLSIVPVRGKEDDADQNPDDIVPDPNGNDFIYEFDEMQGGVIVQGAVQRIWKRICDVSDKVFCLYFLPNSLGKKADMKSQGKTSTVSDQNKKIGAIFYDEMKEYEDYSEVSSHEYTAILAIVRNIYQKLQGRCTESGYNPDLYCHEVGS